MNKLVDIATQYLKADFETKKYLIDYYNENCIDYVKPSRKYKMQYDDEWCAAFTSVIAHKANLLASEFPFEVSVFEQCKIAKERTQYFKGALVCSVGDLVVYDWLGNGGYNHVGIITDINSRYLKVIEGNKGDTVDFRTVKRRSRVIKATIALSHDNPTDADRRLERLAKMVLKGELGDGQKRRDALGADYGEVQEIVNDLLAD